MIAHEEFGKLRMRHFLPHAEIVELLDWEFMDAMWVGEAIGFSEWLRLEDDPDVLRSLAIDLSDFPEPWIVAVMNAIDLPLRRGMLREDIEKLFGTPIEQERLVKDRMSYTFALPSPQAYHVSCTMLNQGGLSYVVIMTDPSTWRA